ncbi:putative GPI-GlcNAc transferase complex, PIG-H component domain-containing protein [Septoria linicola]|nr:putative GPI-GlcNAc transferase complex, PIG-H component domain-containing protein [Septoria linicola]
MLTTKRPTPTTVLYTVSTRSPNKTLASHITSSISTLIRVLAGLLVLTSLLIEYAQTFQAPNISQSVLQQSTTIFLHSPIGLVLSQTLSLMIPRPWRLALCLFAILLIFRKGYTEESLLVIRGLGVQTTTSSPNYLWSSSTRFIPTSLIQDLFIHEAFKGFEVRYYLSIVVQGEEDVVVVFPSILPRREVLEQVWRGAKACLYEPKAG